MNCIDPFDCVSDFCHLAWLIRDNPDLLKAVTGGRCINGTKFKQLDPNGFNHCPVIYISTKYSFIHPEL